MTAPRSRSGRTRDRRDRGTRGPRTLPGPLTPYGTPRPRSPAEEFDGWVRTAAERLRRHLATGLERPGADAPGLDAPNLDGVEFGVEETPLLPADWEHEVPLCTHAQASGHHPARVVVYRLPVLGRARGRADTTGLVLDLLVEEVADLLGRDPDELDPRLG